MGQEAWQHDFVAKKAPEYDRWKAVRWNTHLYTTSYIFQVAIRVTSLISQVYNLKSLNNKKNGGLLAQPASEELSLFYLYIKNVFIL